MNIQIKRLIIAKPNTSTEKPITDMVAKNAMTSGYNINPAITSRYHCLESKHLLIAASYNNDCQNLTRKADSF